MAPKHHPTPLSGGHRKALSKELGKARAMTYILPRSRPRCGLRLILCANHGKTDADPLLARIGVMPALTGVSSECSRPIGKKADIEATYLKTALSGLLEGQCKTVASFNIAEK